MNVTLSVPSVLLFGVLAALVTAAWFAFCWWAHHRWVQPWFDRKEREALARLRSREPQS